MNANLLREKYLYSSRLFQDKLKLSCGIVALVDCEYCRFDFVFRPMV